MRSKTRDITHVNIRRAKVEDNWNEFQHVQETIENQNENETFPYREEFEEFYFKIAAEVAN